MTTLKSIPVFIALLFLGFAASAQSQVGFRAGVLISNQDFKNGNLDQNTSSKFGLDLALVSDLQIAESFYFSPEIHWLQKGSKIDDINGTVGEATSTFNYLEVPLLFKMKFGETSGVFVFLGPSVGYLFDARDKDGDGNNTDIDLEDFNRTELGAHVGAGVKLGPVNVDVRYIAGFSNIANIDDNDLEVRNSGFGAGVSIMF